MKQFWMASALQAQLGYKDAHAFGEVIGRAIEEMLDLEIPWYENIVPVNEDDGHATDFKLSRFACWMVAMKADGRKPETAALQQRFGERAARYGLHPEDLVQLERLELREALALAYRRLSSAAMRAGLQDFSRFNDAGYIGLYHIHKNELLKRREMDSTESLQDHMGKAELEAHLMKTTLTEHRLRELKVTGQRHLEEAHHKVAAEVRTAVYHAIDRFPEELPVLPSLGDIKQRLRNGYKQLNAEPA